MSQRVVGEQEEEMKEEWTSTSPLRAARPSAVEPEQRVNVFLWEQAGT